MVISDPTELGAKGTITHMQSSVCVRGPIMKDE